MAHINEEFLKLQKNYLFADIAKKVNAYKAAHPDKKVISLGIGDVTQPLAPAVIEAMHKAVDDMATKEHFHGMDLNRVIYGSVKPLSKTTTRHVAYILTLVRYLSTMVQRATRETLATY